MTPYLDVTTAQLYFDDLLTTAAWDDADNDTRLKALKQATKAINRLNFAGDVTVAGQENAFPRGGDTDIPQGIKDACAEIAYSLLDGADIELERANLAAGSQGVGDARATYDRALVLPHLAAGIVSSVAWDFLKPFLRDPFEVVVSRES